MVLAHNIDDGERTQDVQISQGVTFDSMLLNANTLEGLKASGFYKPSPIQLHGIPLGKCGFDLLLEAKSGTGKTAVFSVIALEQLDLTKGLQVVILAPTREIASQICDVIKQIGSHCEGLRVEVVMGGLPVQEDIAKFKNNDVHIVVGSPGRLRHLIHDKHIDISRVRLLVLDEADKLLEKSFLADINYIFSTSPIQKQVVMSSATYPESTRSFIKQYAQSAQHICPDSNNTLLGIKQKVTLVEHNINIVTQTKIRFEELLKILTKQSFKQCLIFCNYQARVAELHKMLKRNKWPAMQLYGLQEQLDRLEALKSLQEYKCRILISTDLAARGIDASNVDLVINFEPALDWQTYLHRIGRAGRYGSYGLAITILSKGKEQEQFKDILKMLKVPVNYDNLWETGELLSSNDAMETASISQLSETSTAESLPLDFKASEKCDKLWELLTNDHKANTDDILEDFEKLCSSFKSVKNKKHQIETFSDLLSSLEGHQHAVNRTSDLYHNLKMQQMPFPEYIKLSNPGESKLKSKDGRHKIISNPSNIKIEVNNNYPGENKYMKDKCYLENSNDLLPKDKTKNVDREFHYAKENRLCVKDRKDPVYSHDEYEDTTSSQALLEAGLPTSFGRQKLAGNAARQKNSKYDSYIPCYQKNYAKHCEATNETNKLSYKDTEDSDTSQGFYNIRKEKTSYEKPSKPQGRPITKSGYEVDCENYDYGYKTMSGIYNSQPTGAYSKHVKANKIKSEYAYYTSDSSEKHSTINSAYINWYNNLKFRVKQVEQAIYIQEMCKPFYQ